MFKMHLACRYGLVVTLFEVILYELGCFAKMMAGNYRGDFVGRSFFLTNPTLQFENPAVQT